MKPKFNPGREVMTRAVSQWAAQEPTRYKAIIKCLGRHLVGDWGEVCPEDAQANEDGLKYGDRLMSVYTVDDQKLYIITEHDRSVTTILFPSDY